MKKIILIGGMPTVGKSTIAKALSAKLNLPWMSTDQIREIMKSALGENAQSVLNGSTGLSADEYLTKFTPQEVAEKEYEQGLMTWSGIEAMLHNDWTWRDGFIIEGVNILPLKAVNVQNLHPNVKVVFLSDTNVERTRDVIYTRGLYGKADSYSDSLKEKEVEWVYLFDAMIRKDAEINGMNVIDVTKTDEDIQRILESVGE
jgi:2-phosphoglycerate kinase